LQKPLDIGVHLCYNRLIRNRETHHERRKHMANTYKDFYFEVVNHRGVLQATFSRRWQAEEFAEKYGHIVRMVEM
jgi:hypothetical protein